MGYGGRLRNDRWGHIDERRQDYPAVDSKSTTDGKAALADLNQCFPDNQGFSGASRSAFRALKKAMQAPVGYDTHHVVEQNSTSRFGTQVVQNTANAINLPKDIHSSISSYYSSSAAAQGLPGSGSVRDYVKTLSYDQQRQFGLDSTRDAIKSSSHSPAEKARLASELGKLEKPEEPCP